jgi:exodeoxyribonuclease VII small subunit
MKTFEEKMARLEEVSGLLRSSELPLTDTLKLFEEGVKLAQELEKEVVRIDRKVEKLIATGEADGKGKPAFELFPELDSEEE